MTVFRELTDIDGTVNVAKLLCPEMIAPSLSIPGSTSIIGVNPAFNLFTKDPL